MPRACRLLDPPQHDRMRALVHQAMGRDREATQAIFDLIKNQPGY